MLVGRVLREQSVVQRDGLERGGRVRGPRGPAGDGRPVAAVVRASNSCSVSDVAAGGPGGRRRAFRAIGVRGDRGALRRFHLDDLPVATDPELLLDLQVSEPAHRFGSQLRLGRLVEEPPVSLHGLLEPFGHGNFRRVGLDRVQFGERALLRARGAACRQRSRNRERQGRALPHFPAPMGGDARARS